MTFLGQLITRLQGDYCHPHPTSVRPFITSSRTCSLGRDLHPTRQHLAKVWQQNPSKYRNIKCNKTVQSGHLQKKPKKTLILKQGVMTNVKANKVRDAVSENKREVMYMHGFSPLRLPIHTFHLITNSSAYRSMHGNDTFTCWHSAALHAFSYI